MSVVQCKLTDFPQAWCNPELRCVICRHSPIAPTHTSAGCVNDCRTTAEDFPSAESEMLQSKSASATRSSPRHSSTTLWSATCTRAMPLPPSTMPAKIIFDESADQLRFEALNFISGVRLLISPPSAPTEYISPPGIGSSLINPPMNAIFLPSGDQRGSAICRPGFSTSVFIAPDAASTVIKLAMYQLSSPLPCAAVTTKRLPSGAQSNSYT